MDENVDEEEDLEFTPNPIVLDQLIHDEILHSPETKLDEDFNFLLGFVPVLYQTIEDSRERLLSEHWLDRLLGLRAHRADEKRERNVYLVNLLLNIGSGKLLDPFDKPPPNRLLPGFVIFGGTLQSDVCYRNVNLEVEDFAEYSQESRTFFAAKALPNGNGAFGYLAVSLGGSGDALWLDSQGNDVDPSKIRKKQPLEPESRENIQIYETLKNVISKRSPQKDRLELLPYYYGLMQRIREIANSVDVGCEIFDPVIEKMVEDLQMDIISEGKVDVSELNYTNKKVWLCALQNKIQNLMEAAEKRELTLSHLEKMLVEHEKNDIHFLDVSTAIKPPKMDPILAEAVRDRPSEYNVTRLKGNYSEDIICVFLKLLETEKMHVVNQERTAYDQFVVNMRAEVMNEARYGIQRYNDARKELQRVSKVMKKVEEIKSKLLKEVEKTSSAAETHQHEEEHLIDNEIEDAKSRLEESQAQSENIDGKIAKLHDQIHQLTSEYHKMEEEGKIELDHNLREISDLRAQVAAQDRKLFMLKSKIEENKRASSCEPKRASSCQPSS